MLPTVCYKKHLKKYVHLPLVRGNSTIYYRAISTFTHMASITIENVEPCNKWGTAFNKNIFWRLICLIILLTAVSSGEGTGWALNHYRQHE